MKHTIRFIILLFSLVMTGVSDAWADITENDIIINVSPNKAAGTVSVTNISGMTVTITATPAAGYTIDAAHILVEKMVDLFASRRAPSLASGLEVTGTGNTYSFTIPEGFSGAYVTATFYQQRASEGYTAITSLSDITDLNGKYELTADIFVPSGFTSKGEFTGTLDGGFHKIYNLGEPIFKSTNGSAIVRNIIFEDVSINVNAGHVGGGDAGAVTCHAQGSSRIYNCGILPTSTERNAEGVITGFSGSTVIGTGNVGSIVGKISGTARVINCYSYATVSGGSTKAGIVGNNSEATTSTNLKTMVMNCMFYGSVSGGRPVYSGERIVNYGSTAVNLYNYYRNDNGDSYGNFDDLYGALPAEEEYLTRFEYFRSILNSNRQLCTYWITDKKVTSTDPTEGVQTAADTALVAKWVLDPTIAPYPILKKWGKYPSVINRDPVYRYNPETRTNELRSSAKELEGKSYGKLSVSIKGGAKNSSGSTSREIPITDIDTLNFDYGYYKIQLPYYNEVFGDPSVVIPAPSDDQFMTKWTQRYGGNYKDYVVTGWKITNVAGGTPGKFKGYAVASVPEDVVSAGAVTPDVVSPETSTAENAYAWEDGFNFADRECTNKDLYKKSGRVFAQGGYYYVPKGVTGITIEAYWGKAVYLHNNEHSMDRVSIAYPSADGKDGNGDGTGANYGYAFTPAGTLASKFQGNDVYQTLKSAIDNLPFTGNSYTVYDQAIVLVGNVQIKNRGGSLGRGTNESNQGDNRPYTIMSVDFDLDNEPDYCLELQQRNTTNRPGIHPVRFDFLPVPELGLTMRANTFAYSIGLMIPQGHFEITETAFMHTTQFEYDAKVGKFEAPLILNGGHFEQIVQRYGPKNRTSYILMGGNFRIKRFTPGYHATPADDPVRHCAVNAIGGEYPEFYLSGIYAPEKPVLADNPHCYTNGGKFDFMAGAGYEQVNGNVTFKIDHSIIKEFYGGGINGSKPVTGNIDVTINNSLVGKYCGGPKVGPMTEVSTGVLKTVKTNATGTTFGVFYGGGNGGTSYYRQRKIDNTGTFPTAADNWEGFDAFNPLNQVPGITAVYDNGTEKKGYHAEYEFEVFNSSNGLKSGEDVIRAYCRWAQFGTTTTGNVTNNLTDCTITGDFFGGGNLANVTGNVNTILKGATHIYGSAFAGGYSASIPSFRVHNKTTVTIPTKDSAGNVAEQGSLDYYQDGGKDRYYTWCYKNKSGKVFPEGVVIPAGTTTTNNPAFQYEGKWYVLTTVSLEGLGAVSGNTSMTIKDGSTIDGNVYGGGDASSVDGNTEILIQNGTTVGRSVYGGGNMADVNGNTSVTVTGGTIGATGSGGAEYGNVYGGGKGKEDDVSAGLVRGSTNVSISGSPAILHNVYGGGAYGSVGTFSYDATTGFPTNWTTTDNKGKCTVSITGGTIGSNGDNNGMVFGSSRGLEGNPETNANVDKMAWAYDTDVTIGTSGATTGPRIKGSVYGGGENGHNFHDAKVTVHSGTIGIVSGEKVKIGDIEYEGARFPNRGNVYGSGCGTDTYTGTGSNTYFNFNAGIVRGNTTVDIKGGHVVHNVYGGGAMGSVGTYTFADAAYHTAHPEVPVGKPISCAEGTGTCTVTVSGGKIGVAGAKMAGYGKGGPDDYGHVFGAGRGEMHDPTLYPNVETCAYFNKTVLTISDTAFLTGSAYGGSESGHVLGDTDVTISGGQIGCGKDATAPYTDAVWADDYTPTGDLECASWSYEAPYAPYDPNANATGDPDKYPNGESTEGGRLEASDGHTYYGNVFGGGSGSIPYFDTAAGISKYLSSAGTVEGKTQVTITGGHILTNVYGGCEATNVLGSATITMKGGTVGVPRTLEQIVAHPVTCYIFGAGKGDQRIFFNKETNVDRTEVNIEGGRVYGSIFGGGEDGHVFQNAIVNIGKAGEDGPTIGTTGTSYVDGNVFGGGRGFGGEALTAGNIGGSIELNIKSGKILGSVYGGGRMGSVGYGLYLVDEEITEDEQTIKPYGILRPDDKYDGSYPNPSTQEASVYYDKGRGYITINITGGTIGNDHEYIYNPTTEQKAAIPNTTFDYQNHLQYTKGGNVFTGGMGRLYALDGTTLLPIWSKLGKCKGTTLNMTGGIVKSSIYGGGEIGAVAENATVNIKGGTVGTKVVDSEDATKYYYFGSVFGGGKGGVDNITYPSTTPEEEQIPISEAGTTGGNVQVNLNEGVAEDAKGAVVSQVFGCNDMNGSPKGTVTVHVYATQTSGNDDISTKPEKDTDTYDVMAVYGGGNLAAYEPTNLETGEAKVIIDGCGLTSIRQVYGGGNAASTPATDVEINGTYEIAEVFGGGNGLDALPNGRPNPGANVGYKNYTIYEQDGDVWKAKDDPDYDTKEERTAEGSSIVYGTGAANVNINGGTIHRVFGGSNTKGNVRITAVTMLEEAGGCPFCVDEAYGGGKSAPMDAEAKLLMACIPGLKEAYGGAQNAEIDGDVTLNITNGTFERIFGGNDEKGYIKGTITVNIEETGCKPIIIGELYGGGNQAPYTAPEGKHGPTLNVRSFTSIGDIYGGGLGSTATVTGDTYVNINVSEGRWHEGDYEYATDPSVKVNDKITELNEKGYHAPEFTSGMGSIHTVFGGGNAAPVTGNTNVNVGTSEYEEMVSVATGDHVTDYYTRSGEGTEASPYTYTKATGTAEEGTTYYQKVKGANITGNVYGGGNNAVVTGDTHVVIGEKYVAP